MDTMYAPEQSLPYMNGSAYSNLRVLWRSGIISDFKPKQFNQNDRYGMRTAWVGIIKENLQPYCGAGYHAGGLQYNAAIGGRMLGDVTGITLDERNKMVEYTITSRETPIADGAKRIALFQHGPHDLGGVRRCTANMVLYDDGWRIKATHCS